MIDRAKKPRLRVAQEGLDHIVFSSTLANKHATALHRYDLQRQSNLSATWERRDVLKATAEAALWAGNGARYREIRPMLHESYAGNADASIYLSALDQVAALLAGSTQVATHRSRELAAADQPLFSFPALLHLARAVDFERQSRFQEAHHEYENALRFTAGADSRKKQLEAHFFWTHSTASEQMAANTTASGREHA